MKRYMRDADAEMVRSAIRNKTIGYLKESYNDLFDVIETLIDLPKDKAKMANYMGDCIKVLEGIVENLENEIGQLETDIDVLD